MRSAWILRLTKEQENVHKKSISGDERLVMSVLIRVLKQVVKCVLA